MSKETNKKALKRLERVKAEYMEAMNAFQTEEEIRLAVSIDTKVNLRNVQIYSAFYSGARKALLMIAEDDFFKKRYGKSKTEAKIYRKAVFDLITEDLRKTELFMSGANIAFCNHERDKKGKLKRCDAYFFKEYSIRKKIEE